MTKFDQNFRKFLKIQDFVFPVEITFNHHFILVSHPVWLVNGVVKSKFREEFVEHLEFWVEMLKIDEIRLKFSKILENSKFRFST